MGYPTQTLADTPATAPGAVTVNTPPKSPNSESDTFDVRISRVTAASMQDVPTVNGISDEKWDEIESWLQDGVGKAIATRDERNRDRRERWRMTLNGERAEPRSRRDESHLSVPLTIWASAAVRARVRAGTIESDPLITVQPTVSNDATGDNASAARQLVIFYTSEFRNPRGLGGATACDKSIAEFVPMGVAGYKVCIEPDRIAYSYDATARKVMRRVVRGRVRHSYIAADDLIYPLGFGTDVAEMPFIGHQYPDTWQGLLSLRESGYIDAKALEKIAGQGTTANTSGGSTHVAFQTFTCDEVYFDYPLYADGHPVALCARRESKNGVLLGLQYSYYPRGQRGIWLFNFDTNPDPTNPEGQGVCAKLEGVQEETDLIHNLGIESAKRTIAHVIALREGSGAEQEFGANVPLMPGDHVVTERPEEDIKPIALGSPEGMQAALVQEANSLKYVMRLLGLDESALGNVESGKRVPASLGLEIKKDSRVITSHAIANFGAVMTDITYFTLELLRLRLPEDSLQAAVGAEAALLLKQAVFTVNDLDLRSRFVINFNATDAAATEESRKQQLLVVGQYLQSHYDRVIQYAQLAATLPPAMQSALMDVLRKMENGTRQLLNTIDDIHDPDSLLPKTDELAAAVAEASQQMGAGAGGAAA